ncbi:hypothetical protein SBI67_27445 [Mycolicibacterium sp. 120266]|uniref:hypothetical protein n=1 Tax=Mycolicibacterium sp. 120266 TaxID=3090601 RepID=UPI00299D9DF2|nr:hypothetical protein [Mycolicibacterium sp. 120266]MDX1875869.1 hypothetical protein [Mycolicibacterium sp. 120266]
MPARTTGPTRATRTCWAAGASGTARAAGAAGASGTARAAGAVIRPARTRGPTRGTGTTGTTRAARTVIRPTRATVMPARTIIAGTTWPAGATGTARPTTLAVLRSRWARRRRVRHACTSAKHAGGQTGQYSRTRRHFDTDVHGFMCSVH